MIVKRLVVRRSLGMLAAALVAAAIVGGAYVASEASDGTTSAQEGASSPTATPRSAVVFGTPPPGAQPGSWTPVPRCPEPTPTPTPPPPPTPTPPPDGWILAPDGWIPPPDGWILTPDGWIFAPDRWTPAPTPTPAPAQTLAPTLAPAPWPCVPYDYPEPSGTPSPPPGMSRPEPTPCKNCIDLSKPIPYELPMNIAGKTIYLPRGSTHRMQFRTPLVGWPDPGPTHLHIIERGESRVFIDADTGQIFQWNVAPADEAEFRTLILEPLTSSAE